MEDEDALEEQESEQIAVSDALHAINLVVQYQEQQEQVHLGDLEVLRRQHRRMTQEQLRVKSSGAQQSLDWYFSVPKHQKSVFLLFWYIATASGVGGPPKRKPFN